MELLINPNLNRVNTNLTKNYENIYLFISNNMIT